MCFDQSFLCDPNHQLGDNRRWKDEVVKSRLAGSNLAALSSTTSAVAPSDTSVFESVSRFESKWADRFAAQHAAEEDGDADSSSRK
jgi:hypothetical protein